LIDRRKSPVAREGIPFLLVLAAATAAVWYFSEAVLALIPFALFVLAFLVFRDPRREVVAAALGVVCPVDGRVIEARPAENGALPGAVHRVVINVNIFGTYTARCPSEGKIMDPRGEAETDMGRAEENGLLVYTDEGNKVLLRFDGYRFGIPPRAIVDYGERVGQGQRCAYLRWTRRAELQLPATGRMLVSEGQRVRAGNDLLARLPHP
jgi:phosphatidylserine decarboxylase